MIDQLALHGNLLELDPHAIFRVVDRHHNPGKNLDPMYQNYGGFYPGWGAGTIYNSFNGSSSYVTWQYRAPGNYIPGTHPGPSGVGPLPPINVALPISLPSLSSLNPFKYFKKQTEYDKIVESLQPPPVDPPTYLLPAEDTSYCSDSACCHPSRLGKFPRDSDGNPILSPNSQFATNETIHASVYARFKAIQPTSKDPKFRETEKARQTSKSKLYPQKKGEEKRVTVSLLDWNPGALDAFKETDKAKSKEERYRREVHPSGAVLWIGTCFRTGKLFEMLEEPDRQTQNVAPAVQGALGVGNVMRMLNSKAEGGLPNPWPVIPGQPSKPPQVPRTEEEKEKFWMEHLYLEDGFDLKNIEKLEAERKKRYQEWRKEEKARQGITA